MAGDHGIRWSSIAQAIRNKLRHVFLLACCIGATVLIIYTALFTPLPVYALDKLNLRPFFLPNIICKGCNNFTYEYVIDNHDACKDDVFLLILVASYHANVNARQAIRRTWGGNRTYHGKNIKTLFIFGVHEDKNFQRQLHFEQDKYGDIIQGNFSDFYRSLTNKTMMGLKWVTKYCPKADYVLKSDDDAFNMPDRWIDFLVSIRTPHFIGGYCFTVMPDRWESSKFYIPYTAYPDQYYPTYCSGPGYVLSCTAVRSVVEVATDITFLHMEDVFVSGLARVAAGIQYTQISGVVVSRDELTPCALTTWGKNSHNIVPEQQIMLWEQRVVKADADRDCMPRTVVLMVMVSVAALLWISHMVRLLRMR